MTCGLVWLCTLSVFAQEQDEDAIESARIEYRQALADFEAERFRSARVRFQRAYEVSQHPLALFNFARSCEALGDLVAARDAYRSFLSVEDAPDDARQHAIEHAASLDDAVALIAFRIENLEEDDAVLLDREAVPHERLSSLPLNPGAYALGIERGGRSIHSDTIEVHPGDQRTIVVTLPGEAPPPGEVGEAPSCIVGASCGDGGVCEEADVPGGALCGEAGGSLTRWLVVGGIVAAFAVVGIVLAIVLQPQPTESNTGLTEL